MNDKKLRILVVDDDELLRSALCTYLKSYGYETREYESGEDAVQYFEQHKSTHAVDLVLIDQVMSGMDGITTFQKIHAIDRRIPVIMLTGHSSIGLAIRFMQLGGVNFITKPFAPESGILALSIQEGLNYRRIKQAQHLHAKSLQKTCTDKLLAGPKNKNSKPSNSKWKVLIVSKQLSCHSDTKNILEDLIFDGLPLAIHSAYTTSEAQHWINHNPDVALCLVDNELETEYAGLDMVDFIRGAESNSMPRILLKTNHLGDLPEQRIVFEYEIDGCLINDTITPQNLTIAVTTALRSYRALLTIERQRQEIAAQEKKTRQSEKAVLDFLSNLQHETGTGAHLVLSFIEMALTSIYADDRQKLTSHLKNALMCAQNLDSYHRDLSLVAHMVAGCIKYNFREWDIYLVLESAFQAAAPYTEQQEIALEFNGPHSLFCTIDPDFMEKALSTLLHDTIRYSQPDTKILVELTDQNNSMIITIQSSGLEMTGDELDYLFSPSPEGTAPSTERGGKGFGLTIVRHIIEAHKGSLKIASSSKGGTVFTISLPKAPQLL